MPSFNNSVPKWESLVMGGMPARYSSAAEGSKLLCHVYVDNKVDQLMMLIHFYMYVQPGMYLYKYPQ